MVLTKEQAEGELDEVYGQYAQFEDKNLKIFVINLKPALRRRRFMELQLDNPGLPQWQIVEAVDGRLLNTAEMNDYYDESATIKNIGRALTPSEIGCALSHIKVLKMVVEERIPFALICEDDVVIGRSAFPVIQKLMTMMNPSDPNVTILGNAQTYSSWGIKKVDRFHKLVRVHKSYGTYAYLISLNAAEKFIQNSLPICSSADDWLLYERQRGFQMLGVVPYCISPSFLNNMSTIGNTRHEMMRAASQSRGFSDKVAHYFKKRFSAPQLLKLLKRVKTQPMIW